VRIAARCAPRAMKCTSAPLNTSRAPKYPPRPPDPMTAMRMLPLFLCVSNASRPPRPMPKGRPRPPIQQAVLEAETSSSSRHGSPQW
jgi:hypothetical protein